MDIVSSRWYVVQCLARRESWAARNLEAQHFKVFNPSFLKTVRHARQFRTIKQSLFPGYLFLTLDLEKDRWRTVNSTFGVARLVMGGDYPQPVPIGIVEKIYESLDEKGVLKLEEELRPGDKARVVSGPFSEMLGEIVSLDDRGRVRILLEILNGKIMLEIQKNKLQKAHLDSNSKCNID